MRAAGDYEREALEAFDLVAQRFLGDAAFVASARRDFQNWKPIRSRVVALKQQGDTEAAAEITKTKGVRQIAMINEGRGGKSGLNYFLRLARVHVLRLHVFPHPKYMFSPIYKYNKKAYTVKDRQKEFRKTLLLTGDTA